MSRGVLRSAAQLLMCTWCFVVGSSAYADTIYVGNLGNNTVTVIDNGVTSTISTGNVAPTALAVDASNNLYIANGTNTIYQITPGGSIAAFYNGGRTAQFVSMAADSTGNVYFVDFAGQRVLQATPGGTVSQYASLAGYGNLGSPQAMAFNQGTAFVLLGHYIVNLTTASALQIANGGGVFSPVASLAIDKDGNFYTQSSNRASEVQKFSTTGSPIWVHDTYPNGNYGLAFGSNGALYDAINANPPGYGGSNPPSTIVQLLDPVTGGVVGTLDGFDDPGPIFIQLGPAAPEPTGLTLLGIGGFILAAWEWRRKRHIARVIT